MMNIRTSGSLAALLVLFYLGGSQSCGRQIEYRNYWVELYSTTPCGDVGRTPLGVCSTSCGAMNGENMGTYNCPPHASTCCRPLANCGASSVALNLLWESRDYEIAYQTVPSDCTLNVLPASDTCFVRIDFVDMDVQTTTVDGCGYSYLQINSQAHGNGQKICGTLNHKSTLVKVARNMVGMASPIQLHLHMDHVPHKYSAKINHVKCSDVRSFRSNIRFTRRLGESDLTRGRQQFDKKSTEDLKYMGRMYAVAYTRHPLIRSCPVTFIAPDIVLGPASCGMRLGGPGTSKGLMVIHGSNHEDENAYPKTIGDHAKYVAAHGVVVRSTVFHPMYNHDTHEHDLAIYFLNSTISSAEPVDLPVPVDDFVDLAVYIARYQYKEVSHDVTILHSPEEKLTRIVPNIQCQQASLPRVSAITSNDTICLDITPRENSPCEGEVGSPVVHIGGSGTVTLVGLMMGGYHHCEGQHSYPEPALKLINYLDFIDVATSPTAKVPPQSSVIIDDGEYAWLDRIYNLVNF